MANIRELMQDFDIPRMSSALKQLQEQHKWLVERLKQLEKAEKHPARPNYIYREPGSWRAFFCWFILHDWEWSGYWNHHDSSKTHHYFCLRCGKKGAA